MGVYVKGIKMPKECEYCGFFRFYPENGNVWCNAKNIILKTKWREPNWTHLDVKRPEWCPLVEVPEPHGRLIDVDEITAFSQLERNDEEVESLDEFPTVIEAEDE